MKIVSFRITNFRSIVDTGWRNFSPDNVTVLVGQNESGKTSILEAIAKTFSSNQLSADDTRIAEPLPKVFLKVLIQEYEELKKFLVSENYDVTQVNNFLTELEKNPQPIEVLFSWDLDDAGKYQGSIIVTDTTIETGLKKAIPPLPMHPIPEKEIVDTPATTAPASSEPSSTPDASLKVEIKELTVDGLADGLYEVAPQITLFDHSTGLLPSNIDIDESKYMLTGTGNVAARNFLTVAGLDLKQLVTSDARTRESLLLKANDAVTKDFATFWSQTIGKKSKLSLECSVQTYGPEAGDKAGKKHLLFWISDGLSKLYPKQRSQGVRWFVSFYLQLKASEKNATKRVFLLDEPGANLHSKAQADVIKLINQLSGDIPIVYSTHSPHMLEYDKLYRVLAVQRVGEDDESPTEIKPAHELGTASTDTLSPVLTAMGVNLSSQEVVKKTNNVLLEEMSGFYYLKAFWELSKEKQEANFIAATGVNKIENLANMFRGWGLDYIIVVDDDSNGRKVYNTLKRDLYADDEALAKSCMYKIKDCDGIEDIFSKDDFKKYVLDDGAANITNSNSEFVKSGFSKPVLAYSFLIKVRSGKISLKDLDKDTSAKITSLISEINNRLKTRPKNLP